MIENLEIIKLAISSGIVGGLIIFITTINGIYGNSKAYKIFESTIWKKYGYSKTWKGAFIGLMLGFIYAGLIVGVTAFIYNLLL